MATHVQRLINAKYIVFPYPGSQAFKQLDTAKAHFHDIKFRVQDIILARSDDQNILGDSNLFTKAMQLHEKIMGSGYNDSKICVQDADGACMVVSVLQVCTMVIRTP